MENRELMWKGPYKSLLLAESQHCSNTFTESAHDMQNKKLQHIKFLEAI